MTEWNQLGGSLCRHYAGDARSGDGVALFATNHPVDGYTVPNTPMNQVGLNEATLLYGNERLPTISLTLALPDGRSVDLGQAPVTDQQGIAGLTGRVNQHWGRLFGAVFMGGALRGGMQALQLQTATAGPLGAVGSGMTGTANQATQQRLGRALDTRPTIEVDSGQLCQVLLTKSLHLPAMWQ